LSKNINEIALRLLEFTEPSLGGIRAGLGLFGMASWPVRVFMNFGNGRKTVEGITRIPP
jgi:hypothetical protein